MDDVAATTDPSMTEVSVPDWDNVTAEKGQTKAKDKEKGANATAKRRCVSTACIACRRRKSKCDGNLPKCAACASVYLTDCEYAPHTDHRRKGVYKKDVDNTKSKNSTLQTLIQALLNYEEEDAFDLVRRIRECDNLEELAQSVENRDKGLDVGSPDSPVYADHISQVPRFEAELSRRMGDLVVDGSVRFIGGTSNLIWLDDADMLSAESPSAQPDHTVKPQEGAILGWTGVTKDTEQILHFMNMYFCWHYAYFTTLSKELFYPDFLSGTSSHYCSPLLVNVMLALGCHFSSRSTARLDPEDSATIGDHFFAEAKRLLHENDEFATPKLCTVQALALMSVREAGCGRESKGWVYSGMSFRMASDLGLNMDAEHVNNTAKLSDVEIDARRITFWGCFLFDKCWSNYLGRQPQLPVSEISAKKPEVFASEDSEMWSPYTDSGIVQANHQPARTRAVAIQIYGLAEISSDLMTAFYQPPNPDKPFNKQSELKKLTDIHTRLEAWKTELPVEMEAKDGQLPQILLMHMFYQLLYIHLYRPFLKYTKTTSPLPAHISPRKYCTQAAGAISKLFRLYKRTHGLRQICNIAVYIAHSACTIHLLNLPDKNARRDIVHGLKQLEEIGDFWLCARRTLRILGVCAEKWKIDLPEDAQASFLRIKQRWGSGESLGVAASPTYLPGSSSHVSSQTPVEHAGLYEHMHSVQNSSTRFSMSNPTALQQQGILNTLGGKSQSQIATSNPTVTDGVRRAPNLKPFTQLTKAQQDRWNAHQAKMATPHSNTTQPASSDIPKHAAVLFGGVDSLIEESQNWWYQDQSQLAMGFDNWNSPSTADWSTSGNGIGLPMTAGSPVSASSISTPYYGSDLMSPAYATSSVNPMSRGPPMPPSHLHQQQQRMSSQTHQPTTDGNTTGHISFGQNAQTKSLKRMNSFMDDDNVMY